MTHRVCLFLSHSQWAISYAESYQQFRKSVSYLSRTILLALCTAESKINFHDLAKVFEFFENFDVEIFKVQKFKKFGVKFFRLKRGNVFGIGCVNSNWHLILKFWTWHSKKSPKCPKWDILNGKFSNLVCSIRIFCLFPVQKMTHHLWLTLYYVMVNLLWIYTVEWCWF